MSDLPTGGEGAAEELDLGEIPEETDGDDGQEALDDAALDDGEEEGQEEERPVDEAPRRGRGSDTIRQLRRRAQEAERTAAEERGRREVYERQFSQPRPDPAQAARQQQAFEEQWSMMSPLQQAQYMQQHLQQQLAMERLNTQDLIDRDRFEARADANPIYARHQTEVEREHAAARSRGDYASTRQQIFERIVGREAIQRAGRAAPAQRRAAATRVASARTRPGNARGDGPASGRRPAAGTPEGDDALIDEYFKNGGRL